MLKSAASFKKILNSVFLVLCLKDFIAIKNVRCQAFFDAGHNAKTLYKAIV